jgi:acyl-CoA synthetase (AMP-forming)/AMP-acid ligase II
VIVEGTSFLTVLRRLAEADPDRPALTSGEVTLTRAQFLERVERLAALFAARGVAEGSTVTICLPNSAGLVECLFAAWALGAVPQPISHRLPPLERAAIVELANPSLVVGVPQSEAGGRPALESVPPQLLPGSFTPGMSTVSPFPRARKVRSGCAGARALPPRTSTSARPRAALPAGGSVVECGYPPPRSQLIHRPVSAP